MAKQRKLFEDVAAQTKPAPSAAGGIDRSGRAARGPIRVWLATLFALVFIMIAVGGLTRLTDSGLSITEWAPLSGALPPMTEADWQSEFERYRAIPEYQLQNKGMSMSEFQFIYWWEWGHRQLGRFIGLVWAVGFFGFLAFRAIPRGWTGKLFLLGALGGAQGAIGWWMVASGLTGTMLDVASYRLATHLGLAFVILGLIAWFFLQLGRPERDLMQARRAGEAKLFRLSTGLMHFTFLQILIGALVAGIDAGRSYNDWPLMSGEVFPSNAFDLEPIWRNFFENAGLVQFIHRTAAYLLLAFAAVVWLRGRRSSHRRTRMAFHWVAGLLFGQIVLGIVTVLYGAPLEIAIFHQALAVLLWVAILRARFLARYPVAGSIREGI